MVIVSGFRAYCFYDLSNPPLTWFQALNSRGSFVRTTAEIRDGAVRIPVQKGVSVQEVRFAWDELAMPNLVNAAGLPALPFRTIVTK